MSDQQPEEATPLSDQDKIRLKRIAKLQAQAQSAPAQSSEAGPSTPKVQLKRPNPVPAPAPPTPAPRAKPITVHAAGTSARFAEPFDAWEDAVISRVLQVTLNREQAEASNWSIAYLKEAERELLDENKQLSAPLKISADWTDSLLLARLSLSPATMTDDPEVLTVIASLPANETLFEYLAGCWKRERAERYKIVAKKGADPKEVAQRLEVLNTLKRLIISYLGLVLEDPTMFPQDHITNKPLGALELRPLLLPSSTTATPPSTSVSSSDLPGILQDLSASPEASIASLIGPLVAQSGHDILANKLDIGGGGQGGVGWREHIAAVHSISELKAVAAALTEYASWDVMGVPGATAPGLELYSLLGPFLRLSVFPEAFPNIAASYFPSPTDMSHGDIDSASKNLRGTLAGVQTSLFRIMDNIVRSGPKAREAVLSLIGHVAQANVKRAAMRVDPRTVSSHGYVINLHNILLSFAAPFMDATYSKIDKIDPLYYKYSDRIDIKEITKMQATQLESDAYYAKAEGETFPAPNFISEVFFLCTAFFHIGPMSAIKQHKGLGQQLSQMKRQIDEMEADTTWRGTPGEAQTQSDIDRAKKRRERFNSELHAYEVQLLDSEYVARCLGFGNLVMAWLVRMVDPKKKHPQVSITLPLPEETPEAFRMLPEYLIEDITEFLTFASRYTPHVLAESSQDELLTFMLVFLSTPYMKNPYLKGQFVEIMYLLTRPTQRSQRGSLGDVLNFHPLALKNLMPCLLTAYVQIEITGSHTQFYDKFNTRYYITQIFKLVWSNPTHREALKIESTHLDRYVRFVNLLMNDTTFLLDEGIGLLAKILEIQKLMDDTEAWAARPVAERQEQEKLLRQHEQGARSDLDLGHESLRLLKLFTSETKEPFLTPEIVDRLAAMLDMNLNMLAGPRCQDLKVRDGEKYKFNPKELLADVIQIFIQLGPRLEFQEAVAKDGRSYSRDLFERADRFARKTAIKTDDELAVLKTMVERVEELKAAEEEDDAMGEVPDDFLDPLTYDIMRDPVILPSSKTIVDRSTIKQHYLSDATDPFNRVPLKWEDIVEATELKEQIVAFLAQRKLNRKGAQDAAAAALAAPSTTEADGVPDSDAMKVDL